MAVLMRGECGRRYGELALRDETPICAFEYAFCRACGGALVHQPRLVSDSRQAAA